MTPRRLENKIALITGAARGIGRAITRRLVQEGAQAVITDKDEEGLARLQQEFKDADPSYRGLYFKMDVTKSSEVEACISRVVEALGRIDILVNNAGIACTRAIVDLPEEVWDTVIDTNAKSVYLVTKFVGRQMMRQKYGRIINLASVLGKRATKYHSAYSASKFAVVALTQSAAQELAAYGVNVNAVCPGEVESDMLRTSYKAICDYEGIPLEEQRKRGENLPTLKRFSHPEDIAPLVVFLASADADYITGQAINVCGGILFH